MDCSQCVKVKAAHTQTLAAARQRRRPLQLFGGLRPAAAGHQQFGRGHGQRHAFVGQRDAGQRLRRALHQIRAQRHVAGAQRGYGHRLEVRIHRAAAMAVGRQLQQPPHVGQRFGRAVQVAQADDAVDAQHAEQPCVVQPRAARQPLFQVAERLVIVAELDELVCEIGIEHHVEAMTARGAGLAQRLVHVGESLLRVAELGVAAGDGAEQHAEFVVLQDAKPLFAQQQHAFERSAVVAFAPGAAPLADGGQQQARALAGGVEAGLRRIQLGPRVLRGRVPDQVEAAGQPGPSLRHRRRPGAARVRRPRPRRRCRPASRCRATATHGAPAATRPTSGLRRIGELMRCIVGQPPAARHHTKG